MFPNFEMCDNENWNSVRRNLLALSTHVCLCSRGESEEREPDIFGQYAYCLTVAANSWSLWALRVFTDFVNCLQRVYNHRNSKNTICGRGLFPRLRGF